MLIPNGVPSYSAGTLERPGGTVALKKVRMRGASLSVGFTPVGRFSVHFNANAKTTRIFNRRMAPKEERRVTSCESLIDESGFEMLFISKFANSGDRAVCTGSS